MSTKTTRTEEWNPATRTYARVEYDGYEERFFLGGINAYGQTGSVYNVHQVDADTYADNGPYEPLPA